MSRHATITITTTDTVGAAGETEPPGFGGTAGGPTTALPLRNTGAGRCVDVPGGSRSNGTQVALWDCNGGTNQQWNLSTDGTVVGVRSGLCLAPTGGATADATPLVLSTCDGSDSQKWTRA